MPLFPGWQVFIAFAVFAIVFTVWGWKHVLAPLGYILAKVVTNGFRLLIWTGFVCALLAMPGVYRTWGVDIGDLITFPLDPDLRAQYLEQRENRITPEGNFEPGWRTKRHQPWDGKRHHSWPTWTIILPVVGIYGLVRLTRRKNKRSDTQEITHTVQPADNETLVREINSKMFGMMAEAGREKDFRPLRLE